MSDLLYHPTHLQRNTPLQNEAMYLKDEADTLNSQGYYQEAIIKYTASLGLYMGDQFAWINRAIAYDKLGMDKEAESDRKNAEALNNGQFTVCRQSGEVTFNNEKICKDGT